jgi:hypothetical protein
MLETMHFLSKLGDPFILEVRKKTKVKMDESERYTRQRGSKSMLKTMHELLI